MRKIITKERIVGEDNVDTWRPSRIRKVSDSLTRWWSNFLSSTPPTIEELEEKSGMSAGEIMAAAAKHG